MTRPMHHYQDALHSAKKVSDDAPASDRAAGKCGLGITHLDTALFLGSEKQNSLLFTETTAVHLEENTSQKTAGRLSSGAFYLCPYVLLDDLNTVHK